MESSDWTFQTIFKSLDISLSLSDIGLKIEADQRGTQNRFMLMVNEVSMKEYPKLENLRTLFETLKEGFELPGKFGRFWIWNWTTTL